MAVPFFPSGLHLCSRALVVLRCSRGKLGWGIIFPHAAVLLPLLIWTLLYAIAPLLEKPWLEREFGADYLEYKTKTLRFLVF